MKKLATKTDHREIENSISIAKESIACGDHAAAGAELCKGAIDALEEAARSADDGCTFYTITN